MPTIEQFGEYGLAGLVIFTLFTACFMVVRWIFKHVGDLANQHHDERNAHPRIEEKSEHVP